MNIIDIGIILLLILAAINGYRRGVFKEGVTFLGTILVSIIAFLLKSKVGVLLCKIFPFFNFNGVYAANILFFQIIGFVIVALILFGIFGFVLKATGILQKAIDMTVILDIPSKIGGIILGFINGYILIFIVLILLSVPLKDNELFNSSSVSNKIISSTPILSEKFGNIDEIIISVNDMNDKQVITDQINTQLIDLYLKYNIISREDLYKIIDTGKLRSVKGIERYSRTL